ncbi:MAG TPA: DUF2071 domain-containing protein [Thermoanaerobaculia bacterium]|nr:DUF2071 domain-containing protein [Thermoanaerobaculia bacterium]
MRFPKIHGVIRRRLLVNFRVEPDVMQRHLPAPFRPKLHDGYAIAGICLIRLEDIRPKRVPQMLGLSSENAAHRVAVVWDDQEGVYIPRRDTGSLINHLAGGRVFPGEHHRAAFQVTDEGDRIELHMHGADGGVEVDVVGHTTQELPPTSVFRSVSDASAFFESGALGYSATAGGSRLDGVVLSTSSWRVEPLAIDFVHSSYFADEALFPAGSITFDCALLMRDVTHEWHAADDLHVSQKTGHTTWEGRHEHRSPTAFRSLARPAAPHHR